MNGHDTSVFWTRWGNLATIIAVVAGLGTQGAIYFKQEGKRDQQIEYIVAQLAEFAVSRYTKDDALKDQAVNAAHYQDINDRLKEMEFRVNRSEVKR